VGDDVGDDRDERPRRRRLRAQMLSGAAAHTPEAVVGRLLAVQAQDGRGFRLAVRSRSRGLTAADVDSALGDARLVVTWLNRGTLHLVRTEDYRWLHRLTAHRVLPRVQSRLRGLGVGMHDEERGVSVVVDALTADGPLSRSSCGTGSTRPASPRRARPSCTCWPPPASGASWSAVRWWTGGTPSCRSLHGWERAGGGRRP